MLKNNIFEIKVSYEKFKELLDRIVAGEEPDESDRSGETWSNEEWSINLNFLSNVLFAHIIALGDMDAVIEINLKTQSYYACNEQFTEFVNEYFNSEKLNE